MQVQWLEVGLRRSEVNRDFCTGQEGVIRHLLCSLYGAREHVPIIWCVPVHEVWTVLWKCHVNQIILCHKGLTSCYVTSELSKMAVKYKMADFLSGLGYCSQRIFCGCGHDTSGVKKFVQIGETCTLGGASEPFRHTHAQTPYDTNIKHMFHTWALITKQVWLFRGLSKQLFIATDWKDINILTHLSGCHCDTMPCNLFVNKRTACVQLCQRQLSSKTILNSLLK